ncbi:hypothetical protein MHK_009163 [Candidatus Magnetomorum sp. HK-1]|nr:hypothetical protein MHK_009163 [Candidatus Magnetomorum sp. HK-1]
MAIVKGSLLLKAERILERIPAATLCSRTNVGTNLMFGPRTTIIYNQISDGKPTGDPI